MKWQLKLFPWQYFFHFTIVEIEWDIDDSVFSLITEDSGVKTSWRASWSFLWKHQHTRVLVSQRSMLSDHFQLSKQVSKEHNGDVSDSNEFYHICCAEVPSYHHQGHKTTYGNPHNSDESIINCVCVYAQKWLRVWTSGLCLLHFINVVSVINAFDI